MEVSSQGGVSDDLMALIGSVVTPTYRGGSLEVDQIESGDRHVSRTK